MNDKERAAMQQALKALIEVSVTGYPTTWCNALDEEITALREALADAEKKSSCWRCHGRGWYICGVSDMKRKCGDCAKGKYD